MDLFTLYINPNAFILIPALYFIGLILDQTPKIPKWTHAWIKLMIAVVSCLIYFGLDIRSFVQGVLITGAEMVFKDLIHNSLINYKETKKKQLEKEEQHEPQENTNKEQEEQ